MVREVAVIGAGAAGLVAARELLRQGHIVTVFERGDKIGGTWLYNSETESDLLGLDPSRKIIHSSLYDSLRTNLPREVMGFTDYPFLAKQGRDCRRFPGHQEVLRYLEDFSRDFNLINMVRFKTEVRQALPGEDGKWILSSCENEMGVEKVEVFDAVVVCNGHFTEPRIADIPGIESWPGKQMHSHNYRTSEAFKDLSVLLIGNSASAADVSRDICGVAKEVHLSSRSNHDRAASKQPGFDNIWLHSMITRANEDGTVVFTDGSSVSVDIILHCTGYKYHFPFLKTDNYVLVDDNRVTPLYRHIFPPLLAPNLAFIGLPWKVIPFPMFELQSKWVSSVFAGEASLPTKEEMMDEVIAFYHGLEASGCPKRYTHNMEGCQ